MRSAKRTQTADWELEDCDWDKYEKAINAPTCYDTDIFDHEPTDRIKPSLLNRVTPDTKAYKKGATVYRNSRFNKNNSLQQQNDQNDEENSSHHDPCRVQNGAENRQSYESNESNVEALPRSNNNDFLIGFPTQGSSNNRLNTEAAFLSQCNIHSMSAQTPEDDEDDSVMVKNVEKKSERSQKRAQSTKVTDFDDFFADSPVIPKSTPSKSTIVLYDSHFSDGDNDDLDSKDQQKAPRSAKKGTGTPKSTKKGNDTPKSTKKGQKDHIDDDFMSCSPDDNSLLNMTSGSLGFYIPSSASTCSEDDGNDEDYCEVGDLMMKKGKNRGQKALNSSSTPSADKNKSRTQPQNKFSPFSQPRPTNQLLLEKQQRDEVERLEQEKMREGRLLAQNGQNGQNYGQNVQNYGQNGQNPITNHRNLNLTTTRSSNIKGFQLPIIVAPTSDQIRRSISSAKPFVPPSQRQQMQSATNGDKNGPNRTQTTPNRNNTIKSHSGIVIPQAKPFFALNGVNRNENVAATTPKKATTPRKISSTSTPQHQSINLRSHHPIATTPSRAGVIGTPKKAVGANAMMNTNTMTSTPRRFAPSTTVATHNLHQNDRFMGSKGHQQQQQVKSATGTATKTSTVAQKQQTAKPSTAHPIKSTATTTTTAPKRSIFDRTIPVSTTTTAITTRGVRGNGINGANNDQKVTKTTKPAITPAQKPVSAIQSKPIPSKIIGTGAKSTIGVGTQRSVRVAQQKSGLATAPTTARAFKSTAVSFNTTTTSTNTNKPPTQQRSIFKRQSLLIKNKSGAVGNHNKDDPKNMTKQTKTTSQLTKPTTSTINTIKAPVSRIAQYQNNGAAATAMKAAPIAPTTTTKLHSTPSKSQRNHVESQLPPSQLAPKTQSQTPSRFGALSKQSQNGQNNTKSVTNNNDKMNSKTTNTPGNGIKSRNRIGDLQRSEVGMNGLEHDRVAQRISG